MIHVGKQSWPLGRGERDGGNQLGVVAQTVTFVSVSPGPVEDELAVRIIFDISRAGTDETVIIVKQAVLRIPAPVLQAVVLFESEQEIVLDEGVAVTGQPIPVISCDTGDAIGKDNFH